MKKARTMVGLLVLGLLFWTSSLQSSTLSESILMVGRPISMSSNSVVYEVACPEAIDKPCGTISMTGIEKTEVDAGKGIYDFFSTVNVSLDDGVSTCLVTKGFFQGRSLMGHDETVDPDSGKIPYLFVMAEHDPIQPGQCMGRFADTESLGVRCELELLGEAFDVTRFCAVPMRQD